MLLVRTFHSADGITLDNSQNENATITLNGAHLSGPRTLPVWEAPGGTPNSNEDSLESRHPFDADYLKLLRERDDATERHFAGYFDPLIRIKAAKAGPQSARAADDISQETLLRVLENIRQGRVDHPERLGAYVLAVCQNVIRECFRGDRRFVPLPERSEEVLSSGESVETDLLEEERKGVMRRALTGLSAKDQELLARICLDDQDKDSICRDFGVTREYLRVLLHRARARLRTAAIGAMGKNAG